MKVLSIDLKRKDDKTLILDLQAYSPTLGWTNVGLSAVQYVTPPADGIQEFILYGTPPSGPAPTSIQVFPFEEEFVSAEWFRGVRITSSTREVLTTLRSVVANEKSIGDDWAAINSVDIVGDKIVLEVSYSGGCAKHDFQLSWDGAVIKTLPPQIVLELSHNANGDNCEAFLREELRFDMSPAIDSPEQYIVRIKSGDIFARKTKQASAV